MPRLRFFGSRRFLPKFARRLPPPQRARAFFKARRMEASGLDGSGETRGRQALWITMGDVYREFGRRSALRVRRGLPYPEALDAGLKPGLSEARFSGAAACEDPEIVAPRPHLSWVRVAATGMLRRRSARLRWLSLMRAGRRAPPLDAAAKIGSYVPDNLMLRPQNSKLARKHESVRYGASGLSDRQDR